MMFGITQRIVQHWCKWGYYLSWSASFLILGTYVFLYFIQFARKFYLAQWFRDTASEAEKVMKSTNENEDSKGRRHSKDVESTGGIMQKAESQKKFLRKIIKTPPLKVR